ncbi:toprim domain-containing protein [Dyadobacter sp. OTU695]|uniref:toprim domain-containing protein n=1 Tax=Dyadobacter sp. OTU695 TaxID=3043860 RepID=UPI00313AA53B
MKSTIAVSSEEIATAKAIPIAHLLQERGFQPNHETSGQLVYFSPFRDEKSASFFVNPRSNVFNDFGGGGDLKGDAIRLVQLLDKCSFKEAIRILITRQESTVPNISFSFSGKNLSEPANGKIKILSSRPLANNPVLCKYVENRGIALELGCKYLFDVRYEVNDRKYYAAGFPNDSGGYELRNAHFKGKAGNAITTIHKRTRNVALFEGFFDFLSALAFYGKSEPSLTTIVLNTTSNLSKAISLIPYGSIVNCFLDNDSTGVRAAQKLEQSGFTVHNHSAQLYPDSKDFNEYLLQCQR